MDIEIVLKPANMNEAADYIRLLKMAAGPTMIHSTVTPASVATASVATASVATPVAPAPTTIVPVAAIASVPASIKMPAAGKPVIKKAKSRNRYCSLWTTRDDNRLMRLREGGAPYTQIAAELGRTAAAVAQRFIKLRDRMGRNVTVNVR